MHLRLLLLALLGATGCVTVHLDVPEPEPASGDPAGLTLPSLAIGPVIDAFWVEASDERGGRGRVALVDGQDYVLTVEGTYSVWAERYWRRGVCEGSPEAAPAFASAHATGPVGLDGAYVFALPRTSSWCGQQRLPDATPRWVYRGRQGDPWTTAPSAGPPSQEHIYRFRLVGAGEPLEAAIRDTRGEYHDNYGRLRFTIHEVGA